MKKKPMRRFGENDRNSAYKPWTTLLPADIPVEAATHGIVAAFQNHMVTVFVKETVNPAFQMPDGSPVKMAHLMLQWNKNLRGTDEYFYALKRRIRLELCGPHADAAELIPADWREQSFSQTHLWVMPPGAVFPFGIVPSKMKEPSGPVITKEDLEFYLVEAGEFTEVFADASDAAAAYEKAGKPAPDGKVAIMGNFPVESSSVAWSEATKTKVAKIMERIRQSRVVDNMEAERPQLFYENDRQEYQDSEDAEYDEQFDDDGPTGDEERVAIAGAMREAMEERRERQAKALREANDAVSNVSLDIDHARSVANPKIIIP